MSGVNKFLTFLTILIFMHLSETPFAEQNQQCVPSSCGHIHNISYPFRLKSDPKHCGHENYELSCEGNRTILSTLYNDVSDYYVVQAINYDNSTIRLVDPGIREQVVCSLPHSVYSLPIGFGTYSRRYLPRDGGFPIDYFSLVETITIFSCPFAINSSVIVEITSCLNRSYASNASSDLFMRHTYATMVKIFPTDLRVGCSIDLLPLTSWHTEDANANISILSLHNALAYGFELSWFSYVYCGKCYNSNQISLIPPFFSCSGFSSFEVPSRRVLSVLTRIVPWMLPITGKPHLMSLNIDLLGIGGL
ncbi:uncharacterized protein LOC132628462 [Lycium barbarum]|uniref:uncharacterized protein LOC132628462 n=1 Tax=Lycium barbarum TaxID=112863 RepID=UPI00293F599E|nr:uncharacterized protein LOC132628462 [Lycium barbarum]